MTGRETAHPQPWIEVQDRALIARARAGDAAAMDRLIEQVSRFRPDEGQRVLPGGGRERGPHPGGPDRVLQGRARLPHRPRIAARRIVTTDADERLAWLLVIATIPVGLTGVLFEHTFRILFAKPAPPQRSSS